MYPTELKETKKLIKSIYAVTTFYLAHVVPTKWMRRLIPAERLMVSINDTTREHYLLERKTYRLAFGLQNRGIEVPRRPYQQYKLIAQKYNLPYIRELYDD